MSTGPRRPGASLQGAHVAEIVRRGRFVAAEPLFERGAPAPLERAARDREGRMALVEFGRGRARIVRDLGSPAKAREVAAALLWERGQGRGFSAVIESEAAAVAASADGGSPRRDLVEMPTFTVDPASARDFDDAVSARRDGDGVRLWIHIADVAAHVEPGSSLDREAFLRANSTYVPGSVEPMLPAILSDRACSLTPGEVRLAVTAEILLGPGGDPRKASFYRSRVRSDARLSYEQLDGSYAGRDSPPAAVAEALAIARGAAAALGGQRDAGQIEVDSREPEFAFDSEGNVTGARSVAQTEAHRLIERLMILTNEQVAVMLERRRQPLPYRVHEQPDPQRVARLIDQLASLGLPTPAVPEQMAPREAAEAAIEASRLVAAEAARRGHGRSAYTSLVLRSLKQARYSDRNLGHAGLGSDAYCHFTSPIRRYPDLLAHRALLSAVSEGEGGPDRAAVAEAAEHCSEQERASARLERDADDVCAAFLLERELYESGWQRGFEGEVSGVIGAGAFVAFGGDLGDVYEGFLPARRLRGERFELNSEETALVGSKSGRAVRLGDPVGVTVGAVERARGRVDLEPVNG